MSSPPHNSGAAKETVTRRASSLEPESKRKIEEWRKEYSEPRRERSRRVLRDSEHLRCPDSSVAALDPSALDEITCLADRLDRLRDKARLDVNSRVERFCNQTILLGFFEHTPGEFDV